MKSYEERMLTVGWGGILIIIGLLLSPFLIGIPILFYGFYVIFRHGCSKD